MTELIVKNQEEKMKDLFNISGKKAIVKGGTRVLGMGMAEAL